MQKEFEYLACDEELKSEHVGGKKKIKHMIANKNLCIWLRMNPSIMLKANEDVGVCGKKKIV